jgi:uncharacterized protein YdbL (DUF1318 family)
MKIINNKPSKIQILTIAVLALSIASSAFALDLQQARAEKILGEKPNGYVEVLKASPEATKLADEVNAMRKKEYERISKENGQPVDVVAKVAAEEIAKKLKK